MATELGGGGHPQASGFRMYEMTLSEAEEKVLHTIEKHLKSTQTQPLASQPTSSQPNSTSRPISISPETPAIPTIDSSELDYDPDAEPFDPDSPPDQSTNEETNENNY
jgi:hypothetical protein